MGQGGGNHVKGGALWRPRVWTLDSKKLERPSDLLGFLNYRANGMKHRKFICDPCNT